MIYASSEIFSDTSVFQKKYNLLFLPEKQIRVALTKNPYIKEINLIRQFPSTLVIRVVQRRPLLKVDIQNQTMFIDEEGNSMYPLSQFSNLQLPLLTCSIEQLEFDNTTITNRKLLRVLTIIYKTIQKGVTIDTVVCEGTDTFFFTSGKTQVLFSSVQNSDGLASSLQYLFKQFRIESSYPERLDMRFEKPVLVPKIEALTPASDAAQKETSF